MFRFWAKIWISMLLAAAAAGQHYNFRLFDKESGLSSLEVRCLYQDHTGFLWVGTPNGLFRYEGGRFVRFGVEHGLASPSIEAVHQTGDGTLWVATLLGLARFDGQRFQTAALDGDARMFGPGSLHSRGDQLYAATSKGLSVGRRSGGDWQFHRLPMNLPAPDRVTMSVFVDAKDQIWFGCGMHLCVYRGGEATLLGPEAGVPKGPWLSVGVTPLGDIYARNAHHLIRFPGGSWKERPRSDEVADANYRSGKQAFDHAGRMMLPTLEGLAIRTSEGRWRYVGLAEGLPEDRVSDVLRDREGIVWIGTPGFGLVRWAGYDEWETFGRQEGFASETIWGLQYDSRGTLWAGTSKGVHRFHNGRWELWPPSGIPTSEMVSIAFSRHGTMWVGTYPNGLFEVNLVTGKVLARYGEPEFGTSWISEIAVDDEDRLWVPTVRGLFRQTRTAAVRFERQLVPGTQVQGGFQAVLVDCRGRVWAAGKPGLVMFNHGQWRRFDKHDGLKATPGRMAQAPDGSIWVSYTEPAGISRLEVTSESVSATHWTTQNGLKSDMIVALGFDRLGRTWAGTDNGVDVMYPDGWRHYGQADGVASNDINYNSLAAGPNGDVWVGTNRGLSHFLADRAALNPDPPQVAVTSVAFGKRGSSASDGSVVSYDDRAFHVRFAALTFLDEAEVRFRYRLAGMDDNWTTTAARELHLPRLPAGSYRFEVMARNSRGVWSAAPATFSFRIRPPWYLHPLTLAAEVLLGALLIWGMYRWRTLHLLRQKRLLESKVTDRTRELNEAKERAEDANRLKTEFLARMSHEIRTPMNAILGITSEVLGSPLAAADRENLEIVRESGESLMLLLNDLLDISRIEAGHLPIEHVSFPLRASVLAGIRPYAEAARRKGLVFEATLSDDLPQALRGDPLRLRQILANLLANAIKFTEHGSISLDVRIVNADHESATVAFAVRDTGIGIPASKLKLIREPFRQADGSTTRKYGGTGLGLAICDRLVELMKGAMTIESEPDRGSTFLIEIPFPLAACDLPAAAVASATTAATCSILLAEDNLVNQRLAARLLAKRGHSVTPAINGKVAVECFEKQPFDVVLMDIDMPVMDGYAATEKIRDLEKDSGTHVPVIAVTAHATNGGRERCIEAGMDDFIAKPYRAEELYAAVDAWAARRPRPACSIENDSAGQ